jgi:hypothetical protein
MGNSEGTYSSHNSIESRTGTVIRRYKNLRVANLLNDATSAISTTKRGKVTYTISTCATGTAAEDNTPGNGVDV